MVIKSHNENQEKIRRQKRRTKKYQRKHRRKPSGKRRRIKIMKQIAFERINYLMESAISIYSHNKELANRYVELARNYSKSAKVLIPREYKRLICHKCKKLMVPGVSSRTRIQSRKKRGTRLVITCLNCGNQVHIFFKTKKHTGNL
ncbi:MAG: hypothetical protein GF364_18530 [Candidatus Lokiarchaeota archaeon]|nr:hypothetical protein [Candidatus Lokiarchaeota archaeon]